MFGLPGSGKSTLAKNLSIKLTYEHIELGKKLRTLSNSNSHHSDKAKEIIANGAAIPSDILSEIMNLEYKNNQNIILDGFPRNKTQYNLLKREFKSYSIVGILLDTPIYIAKNRLKKRKVCPSCNLSTLQCIKICPMCKSALERRTDDFSIQTVHKRIKTFNNLKKTFIPAFSRKKPLLVIRNRNIKFIQQFVYRFLRKNNVKSA